ncbi:MAG: TOBE domain-containing protein, partial [Candidatus Atribacteria bacterium]|nr:TOBE domain-containing protein [Candidatus Atribacteria bacterium]
GTPDEIYNSPASTFVASFIGDMNFLEGQVVQKGENSVTIDVDGKPILSSRLMGNFSLGDSVVACIRPEKICFDKLRDNEILKKFENHFQASIHRIVFRGTDYEITLKFGQSEIRLIESASEFNNKKIGDQLFIGFQKDDVITYLKECKKVCDYETNFDN